MKKARRILHKKLTKAQKNQLKLEELQEDKKFMQQEEQEEQENQQEE